jgi:hypothetical protein
MIQPYAPQQVVPGLYLPPAPVYVPALPQGLSFLIHGGAKAGKSSLGDTVPAPRLILDVEGGSRFTHSRKRYWDPSREGVPQQGQHLTAGYGQPSVTPDWESAIVMVREARQVDAVYRIMNSGQHPFNGLTMDSHTEVQQRMMDDLAGGQQLSRDNWGALLRKMNNMTRQFRDLITHPVKPIWGMCFITGSHLDSRTSRWRPMLQGQTADYLPYYVDVLGYISPAPDGTRHLLIGPHQQYETGERIGGRLPMSMQLAYPQYGIPGYDISNMITQVIG